MIGDLIPTRVHGILDYLVGLLLIAAPWLFGFSDNRTAMLIPIVLGISTILYSLLTNYELGLLRVLPMSLHLWIDLLAGLVLATSPWLFHFANRVIWPHLGLGLMEVVVVLLSSRVPSFIPPDSSANDPDIAPAEVV